MEVLPATRILTGLGGIKRGFGNIDSDDLASHHHTSYTDNQQVAPGTLSILNTGSCPNELFRVFSGGERGLASRTVSMDS
jgi:hypothetical protein